MPRRNVDTRPMIVAHFRLGSIVFAGLSLVAMTGFAADEFRAVVHSRDANFFMLRDTESGRSSGWLQLGDLYKGQRLSAYDAEHETLDLTANGRTVTLRLPDAHVATGQGAIAAQVHPAFTVTADKVETVEGKIRYSGNVRIQAGGQFILSKDTVEADVATPNVLRGDMTILSKSGIVVVQEAKFDPMTGKMTSQQTPPPPPKASTAEPKAEIKTPTR